MKKFLTMVGLLTMLVLPMTANAQTSKVDLSLNHDSETARQLTGWDGEKLNSVLGVVYGPTGKETYYNLNMKNIINIMSSFGYTIDDYHIRDDGVKMLGDYIMVATDFDTYPRGSIVSTSLGLGISCDTGTALSGSHIDIATNW